APLAFDLGPGGRALLIEPVPDAQESLPGTAYRLLLQLGEGWAEVATDAALVERLLGAVLPGLALSTLEPGLQAMVQEMVLAPLLAAAEAGLGRAVRVASGPVLGPLPYRLEFRASIDGGDWPVSVALDLRGLELVTRAFERVP